MIILFSETDTLCEITDILSSLSFTAERYIITADTEIPDARICICSDSNLKALKALEKSRLPVISCGMNSRNTITLSGCNEKSCSLDLRRKLYCLDGSVIEPAEFPVKISRSYRPFTVMAVSAVALLNGKFPVKF